MPRKEGYFQDDEALVIDIDHLLTTLRQRFRWILVSSLAFMAVTACVVLLAFNEKYRSEATLLFNPVELQSVVSPLETANRFFKVQSLEVSPFKNQEQFLKSRLLAKRVHEQLKRQGLGKIYRSPDELMAGVIGFNRVMGTDFIKIYAEANSSSLAQNIANAYKDSYLAMMNEISYQPLLQQEKFFKAQSQEAEQQLLALNHKVQGYQEKYGILDINVEGQAKVNQLEILNNNARTTEAMLSEKRASVKRLRQQLQLQKRDITAALNAVASGQDPQLSLLQEKLQESQKEYHIKALTYAPTNPDMQQLEQRIAVLKKQMTDQQIMTIGQTMGPKTTIVKDNVRADLISNLAEDEVETFALSSKLSTLRSQYGNLKGQLKGYPQQKLEYAHMLLEKKNKENVLEKLREKLSEVQIQKAAIQKKLVVIDEPDLPKKALFPGRIHIIALSGLAGALLSIMAVLGHATWTRKGVKPEFIEKSLELPVLSIIPWVPEAHWKQYRKRGILDVTASPANPQVLKAYQDLALNLKVQRNILQKNTMAVSSLVQGGGQSVILANLSFCLAQSGERVLLVDTNLRKPKLHTSFNQSLDYEKGLPELINSISELLFKQETSNISGILPLIQQAATPSGIHPDLHYLNAGVAMENTFEFLNSKGFKTLIQVLKNNYDWVLLDAPSFLQVPDTAALLAYTDGLLLLVEREADEAQVQAVKRRVERLNSSIIGVVLRPFQE